MLRVAFNLAAPLSLVVLALTPVLWIRAQFASDYLHYSFEDATTFGLGTTRSGVGVVRVTTDVTSNDPGWEFSSREPTSLDFTDINRFGDPDVNVDLLSLGIWSGNIVTGVFSLHLFIAQIPFWLLLLFSSILPALKVWRRQNSPRRRLALGLCPACGYDLRGTETTAACPECGAARAGSSASGAGAA